MSLINRYPTYFSVTQIIGNSANDYSTAPRNKQNFFDIARAGSSMPEQASYWSRTPEAPDYRYPLQPLNKVGYPVNVFSNVFSNAAQARNQINLNEYTNPSDYLGGISQRINNLPNNLMSSALAGRFYNYF